MTTIARTSALLALLAAGAAGAQDLSSYKPHQTLYILNYEVSAPMGSLKDNFVSDVSWRGVSFEGRSMLTPDMSAGVGFTYNRYAQTYSLLTVDAPSGGTISGPVYRYMDQFAIKGLFHYYFMDGSFRPYGGVGLGGVWAYAMAQVADLAIAGNGFYFIAAPEVGFTWTAAKGASSVGLNVAVRYNYTTADFAKVNDAQNLSFVIGFFGGY